MQYSEFVASIKDYFLDSKYPEIQDLLMSWVEENISDLNLQDEALGHASAVRKISSKVRRSLLTVEEGDVAYNVWWTKLRGYLQTLKTYIDRINKLKAKDQSQPELVKKVRQALEDLNYKKEILLFRRFQVQKKENRGAFLINGSKYYGQNWLYRLLLKPVIMKKGRDTVREVVIDFSGQIPIDLFWFELYDQFKIPITDNDAEDRENLLKTIIRLWQEDRSIVFRIDMNGDIPTPELQHFLDQFWKPLYQLSEGKESINLLLLFIIFGQPFDHAGDENKKIVAADFSDTWTPALPLVLNIEMLKHADVLTWLEGRIMHFEDLLDLNTIVKTLMKNQESHYPEMVMMAFCMRYKLSFQTQILAKF